MNRDDRAAGWSSRDDDGRDGDDDPDRDEDGDDGDPDRDDDTDRGDDGADRDPEDAGPRLHVNNANGQQLAQDSVVLTGTVSAPDRPDSGIDTLRITSDRFPETGFAANRSGATFEAEVPLVLGVNNLTITARDLLGNTTVVERAIVRDARPHFANVTPANGSVITDETVTIEGEVRTLPSRGEVSFFVNEWQLTPTPTDQEGVSRFSLPDLPLEVGDNVFTLRAVNDEGANERALVLRRRPGDADPLPPPDIELLTPSENQLLNSASFRLKGRVASHAGGVEVSLNGEPVNLANGLFEGLISFPEGADQVTARVVATDSLGNTRESSYRFNRDDQAPRIRVDNGFSAAPALNPVSGSPVRFSGTVMDTNLAGLRINDEPVRLRPGAGQGEYEFGVALNVPPGQERPVTLKANDRGGNTTTVEYRLKSDDSLALELQRPRAGTRLLADGEPREVDVAARLSRRPDGISARARVGSGASQPLALTGPLASGSVALPADPGRYRITLEILGDGNSVLASTRRYVELVDADDIEREAVRSEPTANATNVEPNAAVEVHFNKPLDPSKLNVQVRETLHGRTYVNNDPLGASFLEARGAQLTQVHRDRVRVPGEVTVLPGNRSLAFFPARHYGFNARVFVDVLYDGEPLERFRFRVRPLPTFVIGGIRDQFGQPLAGMDVALPELGLTATTNNDGAFSFGFNTRPGERIPGGRHELVINPGFDTPGYGSERTRVSLEAGRRNELGLLQVPELSDNAPFQQVSSGQPKLSLAGGELTIDVSNAQLLFQRGRTAGRIQVQFFPFSHLAVDMMPGLTPLWAYATQPRGVRVEGRVGIRMRLPELRGGYDYIPPETERVVLLGFDTDREVLAPVGIARIDNHTAISENAVALDTLDYIAIAFTPPRLQPLLKDVAEGTKSLNQLIAELQ